jgi:hypothetical protein
MQDLLGALLLDLDHGSNTGELPGGAGRFWRETGNSSTFPAQILPLPTSGETGPMV